MNVFQKKPVLFIGNDSLFLHFGKFVAHGAAVYSQIIRQLLAVIGDLKGVVSGLFGALGKIRHEPSPDGLGTGVQNSLGQLQAFVGTDGQQIPGQPCVEGTGIGTGGEDSPYIHE